MLACWRWLMSTFDPSYDVLQRMLKELKLHSVALERARLLLAELSAKVDHVSRKLPPSRPGWLTILNMKGTPMANVITFDVGMPSLPASHDVVKRELSSSVDGGAASLQDVSPSQQIVAGFSVPQNANVLLALVDIDDAGNRSEPSILAFQALDTVPPAKPGDMTVLNLTEV